MAGGLIAATALLLWCIALWQEQNLHSAILLYSGGALFGFLWYNVHPAMLFMVIRDRCSGATLVVALRQPVLLLPIISIIPTSIC